MTRRIWSLVPVTFAVIGISACGGGASSAGSSASTPLVEAPQDASALPRVGREWRATLSYVLSDEEEDLAHEAWQYEVELCMRQAGFDYIPVTRAATFYPPHPLDRSAAGSTGYHLPESYSVVEDPNEQNAAGNASFALSLFGDDTGPGCAPKSLALVYADDDPYITAANTLMGSFYDTIGTWASSDERSQLMQNWAECMNERGFDYASTDEANSVFSDAPSVTPLELDVRAADLSCDVQVGLTEGQSATEASLVDAWLSENAPKILVAEGEKATYLSRLVQLHEKVTADLESTT